MKNIESIDDMLAVIGKIEGWLSPFEQLALLYLPSIVDHLPGSIVEVGSFKGKSTIALAMGSIFLSDKKRPIYAMDSFENSYYHSFKSNIRLLELENHVIPFKKTGTQIYNFLPKSISAIFIDGSSDISSINRDILHCAEQLVEGGLIVFRHYSDQFPEITSTINTICNDQRFEHLLTYDTLVYVQKK